MCYAEMQPEPEGEYVKYAEFAALQAENAKLSDRNLVLEGENFGLENERDKALALAGALKRIYDDTEGYADGAEDASAHDKVCNNISGAAKSALATFRADQPGERGDRERLDWLEQTVLGTGGSKLLKSIFLCHNMHEAGIQIDVKTQGITSALTLRQAIDTAMQTTKQNAH